MNKDYQRGLLLLGLLISIGLSVSGYFISQTIYNAKVALNTAEVKGLAEKRVKADRVNWTILYKVTGANKEDMPNLYQQAERNQKTIINLLKENGFSEAEIEIGVLDYKYQEFRDKNQVLVDETHKLIGTISVESEKVELVKKVRSNVNKLISEGVDIVNKAPSYYFTKLNEIKPEMLSEATKNARIAANQFAKNANVRVGGIRSARQGNFNVRDAGKQYGDATEIEKDIRVVTTITFYLTD